MKNMTELHDQLVKEDRDVEMKYKEPIPIMIDVIAAIEILKKKFSGGKKNEKILTRSIR